MKFLNSKERKNVVASIVKAYSTQLKSDYLFVIDKNLLFAVTKGIMRVQLNHLHVKRIGLQIGTVHNGEITLLKDVRVLLK